MVVAERSPTLARPAPRRQPAAPVDHVASARLTERHRRGEPTSTVERDHREGVAEDGVRGCASAAGAGRGGRARRSGCAASNDPSRRQPGSPSTAHRWFVRAMCVSGRRVNRQLPQTHQSGIAPGNRSGSPGKTRRQRPQTRGCGGPSGVRPVRGDGDRRGMRRLARSASGPATPPEVPEGREADDDDTEDEHEMLRFLQQVTAPKWVRDPAAEVSILRSMNTSNLFR